MGADKPIVDTGRHGQVVRTQNNTTVKTWVVQVLEAPHAAIVCQAINDDNPRTITLEREEILMVIKSLVKYL